MVALLDHLTAILIGASLLCVLLFVQQRNKQAAVEATVHHAAQEQAFTAMEVIERDSDNMRLFDAFRPLVRQSGGLTTQLTFHTLADPDRGQASSLVAVTYRLEDTYRTMAVDGQTRPVYRLARYVNDGTGYVYAGGSTETVLDFDVALLGRDGSVVIDGSATDALARLSVDLVSAVAGPERVAGDQASTAATNLTQQGGTFRPVTLTATRLPDPAFLPDANAPLPAPPPPGG
jgi:hypothetical protein